MRIKEYKKKLIICILTIINFIFYSCSEVASDSLDDILITVKVSAEDVYNVQVYTVNGWKYVKDVENGSSVTVDDDFKMKFIQITDNGIRYYYFSNLIATAEGSTFTIEDMYSSDDDTTVQVWRNSRTYPFEVTPDTLDYYKISLGNTITSLGTVKYQTPYISLVSPNRVDYNEIQETEYKEWEYDSDSEVYFGNWDFSDNSSPVLNEYTDIEIEIAGTVYTVSNDILTENSLKKLEYTDLIKK